MITPRPSERPDAQHRNLQRSPRPRTSGVHPRTEPLLVSRGGVHFLLPQSDVMAVGALEVSGHVRHLPPASAHLAMADSRVFQLADLAWFGEVSVELPRAGQVVVLAGTHRPLAVLVDAVAPAHRSRASRLLDHRTIERVLASRRGPSVVVFVAGGAFARRCDVRIR